MRGGVFVGMGPAITPGTLEARPVSGSRPVDPVTGGDIPDPFGTTGSTNSVLLGGRRRKLRKGGKSKKTKKGGRRNKRRHTMRGGRWNPNEVNSANTRYGFVSPTPGVTGGIAPATGEQANIGGAPMNAAGVRVLT